MNFVPHRF